MITHALAMVSFVAPWMAWGAVAAVGLPVLAHLLSRTRYREVVFPAARLVQQAVAATSRIETPRHRLLMLLRWLVLMLLVLAFMRPQWTPKALADDKDQGIALLLLVDASASMQRAEGGATLYARAMREAHGVIDQLDPTRDVAAVIRVDHTPTSLLPEATAQFGLLADRLSSTKPGYTHANWAEALAAAQRLVIDEPRTVRLITISDQQGEQPDAGGVFAEQPGTAIDHLRIEGPTDNTAVRLIDVRPYPAIAGQPITATVEVQHFGDSQMTIGLTGRLGSTSIERKVSLGSGTRQRVDFTFPAAIGGRELIQVALDQSDAMPSDNLSGRVVTVQEQTAALIVHDPNAGSQTLAQRLATLLNPGEVEGVTLPNVETIPINEAQRAIRSADPATLRTIVLINASPLPDATSQLLEAYAQAGGGVVQFAMDGATTQEQMTTASGIDFGLEPLRIFEGPARAGLAALRWPGVSNAPIDERAKPILIDELERVIVAEMPRGRGRLIAINASLNPGPGGLLAEPAFVVLFSELCRFASPGPALPEPIRPGDTISARLLNADQLVVPKDADPDAVVFTTPGRYAARGNSGLIQEVVFVELDPSESETTASPVWSAANNPAAGNTSPKVSADSTATSLRADPVELWPYLVLGVLALAACESLLLWRFAGPSQSALQGGAA